jgi:hypothetical protein
VAEVVMPPPGLIIWHKRFWKILNRSLLLDSVEEGKV